MSTGNNVVKLNVTRQANRQELIDDIGARAFLFLRDLAQEHHIPIKEVIIEHLLGMALVVSSVEGCDEAQRILGQISQAISSAND